MISEATLVVFIVPFVGVLVAASLFWFTASTDQRALARADESETMAAKGG